MAARCFVVGMGEISKKHPPAQSECIPGTRQMLGHIAIGWCCPGHCSRPWWPPAPTGSSPTCSGWGGDDLEKMKSGLSSQKGITMLRILNDTTKKHRTKICLVLFGAPAGIRIPDTLIKSQVLYQLSYGHKYSICLLQLKYCNRYGRKSQAFCRIFSQKICRRAAGAGT